MLQNVVWKRPKISLKVADVAHIYQKLNVLNEVKKNFVTVVNEIKLFWRKLRKSRLPSQAETT